MQYENLIYKLGSLHSLLRECAESGLLQGEHTITYVDEAGIERTFYVNIQGDEIEMSDSAASRRHRPYEPKV